LTDADLGKPSKKTKFAALQSVQELGEPAARLDMPFAARSGDSLLAIGAVARVPKQGQSLDAEAVAVGLSLPSGTVSVAPALRQSKSPTPDTGQDGDALQVSTFQFDVGERLFSGSAPEGHHRIYVIYRELISNGVTVEVGQAEKLSGVPALTLSGPATATTEPGGVVTLEGVLGGSGQVHLIATGDADAQHISVTPAEDGSYSINLLGDNPLPKAPGTWHVYALSGEAVAGPVTIELTPGETPW
jgi:hypothetical protein